MKQMITDIKFVTTEKVGLTQYIYLGYVKRRYNRTITGQRAISADNPLSLNILNLQSLDRQGSSVMPIRDLVLVNGQQSNYTPDELMHFAHNFNQQGYSKKIVKVIDEQGLALERAVLMN